MNIKNKKMKLRVGVLGATGMVGQRFIESLEEHPWFEIEMLAASEKSKGKMYKEVAKWYLSGEMPRDIAEMEVSGMDEEGRDEIFSSCDLDLAFSAIPSDIALEVEAAFAHNIPVFSNTSTYRMKEDVPLIIPEINPKQLDLIEKQKKNRSWNGFIVTNPNCTTIGFTIPLKPILDNFGIKAVHMASMQALSGAGYDGVPSMAIIDNVIPFIKNEEEKVEEEALKIRGAEFDICASCNRVNVMDGHTESVFVKTEKDFELDEVKRAMGNFKGLPQEMKLPTAPKKPIIVFDQEDRPQPRKDRMLGNGMSVSVGRLKKKGKLLKFTCLSHNTIRGAAGASVLNAELAHKKGLF